MSRIKISICSLPHGSRERSNNVATRLLLGLLDLWYSHDETVDRVPRVT